MTEPAPLCSIPEAPAPAHGGAEWFEGSGGVRLRAALFAPEGEPKGSVVLSPGRTEPIEKYFEVVQDLQAKGYVVLVHDWRGQGLSHRALPDRRKGHAHGWADFVADYGRLLDAFEPRLPKPWIAMAHSMGGCLTTLALANGQAGRFKAAILSAPMLGLQTGKRPAWAARALAWVMSRVDPGGYVLGDPGDPFKGTFESDHLGHDRPRWDRYRAQIIACPDIALGGPTWGWLDFAFSACAWIATSPQAAKIDIPFTILGAGADHLVLPGAGEALAKRLPQGRYVGIPSAYHEIQMETDDIRAIFWREFDAVAAAA